MNVLNGPEVVGQYDLGVIRTCYPGTSGSDLTYFVDAFDYQHRDVPRQLQDLVPLRIIGETFCEFLDQLIQIELSGLELFQIREGEHEI